ncbi:MAG: hypothetical protein FD181_1552 [Prolixibacteraceae bacterium]|nr:MAG: hypothetical protein FD181_1552 [Prolixibacteraceae bacterium]
MGLNKNIIFVLLVLITFNLYGQGLEIDTRQVAEIPVDTVQLHSPKKAAIYSAILPGLGQAYNKKYWKIPLIYAGFGTIGYFIGWNNGFYSTYKKANSDLTDGDPESKSYLDIQASKYYDLENPTDSINFKTGLSKQSDYYRRNRDLLIISLVGFYGLNIIDASVDAHLFDFDISEDLTLNWQPAVKTFENQLVYGINCTFKF